MTALLLLGIGAAYAQALPDEPEPTAEAIAQAKELYRLGAGLYAAGRYEDAIGAFLQSHELSGNDRLLCNVANAQERLGQLAQAAANLRQCQPHVSNSEAVSLSLRITSLEERVAAEVTAEPEAPSPAPPAPAAPSPTPPVDVAASPSPPAPSPRRRPRWGLVGAGVAIAGGFGAAAAYTYTQGLQQRERRDPEAYRVTRLINNVSVPMAGVGGGLAVLGLLLPVERSGLTVTSDARTVSLHVRF